MAFFRPQLKSCPKCGEPLNLSVRARAANGGIDVAQVKKTEVHLPADFRLRLSDHIEGAYEDQRLTTPWKHAALKELIQRVKNFPAGTSIWKAHGALQGPTVKVKFQLPHDLHVGIRRAAARVNGSASKLIVIAFEAKIRGVDPKEFFCTPCLLCGKTHSPEERC